MGVGTEMKCDNWQLTRALLGIFRESTFCLLACLSQISREFWIMLVIYFKRIVLL